MHTGPCTILLALAFSPVLIPQSAAAQTAAPTAASAPACNCPTPVVQRHFTPYSAKQKTTRVQTLANGTTTTTVTTAQLYRDADGRTRTDTTNTLADGIQYHYINLYDPVEQVRLNWTVGNPNMAKVVSVYHYQRQTAQTAPANPQTSQRYYPTTSRSLPPRTIDGLYATGMHTTRTIPVGDEGNNRDMTTTTVYWYSPALGIQLRSTIDDPRNGKTTIETTDIQQAAPDPALFKAPAGYQVRDTNQ